MTDQQYAGFWNRFAALFIDVLILLIPQAIFGYIVGMAFVNRMASTDVVQHYLGFEIWSRGIALGIAWLYFALMESSKYQATVGKLALRLVVTDMNGCPLSFGRASGRFFGKILSSIIFGLGYVMAGVTPRKQSLHDMLASCLVLKRSTVTPILPHTTPEGQSDIPPPIPISRYEGLQPIIAWARRNTFLVLIILGAFFASIAVCAKYAHDHLYWTTVCYGKDKDFAVSFKGEDTYLYKGINRIRYREGEKMLIWYSCYSDDPDVILSGATSVQIYKDDSSWWNYPDDTLINITKREQRQREQKGETETTSQY